MNFYGHPEIKVFYKNILSGWYFYLHYAIYKFIKRYLLFDEILF
jgi:hypothetical protein